MEVIIDGIKYVPSTEEEEIKGEIKVGNVVRITDAGKSYSSYHSWYGWKRAPLEYAIRYQFEGKSPDKGKIYIVRYIGEHEYGIISLAIIENVVDRRCYLIDVDGIEKIADEYWG